MTSDHVTALAAIVFAGVLPLAAGWYANYRKAKHK